MMAIESEILKRYVDYLESAEFTPTLKRLTSPPAWRYLAAFVAFMTTIGIPIAIYQVYKIATHRKRRRKEILDVARRSRPLVTYPLMVNRDLLTRPGSIAPGLVVGSFDPKANETVEFMATLAEKVAWLGLGEAQTPDERQAAELMEDEAFVPSRRRRLPGGLTGGREVYAFDLMILGDYLPSGTVEVPMIPCVAEPGPAGEIHMIPFWVATGEDRPDGP